MGDKAYELARAVRLTVALTWVALVAGGLASFVLALLREGASVLSWGTAALAGALLLLGWIWQQVLLFILLFVVAREFARQGAVNCGRQHNGWVREVVTRKRQLTKFAAWLLSVPPDQVAKAIR
ncbi:MAG TPA: hypothetical protein VD997_15395 [Phycisphaerales bacterium]|nr:hypothetical protein [Phycisphaerales bacterium]